MLRNYFGARAIVQWAMCLPDLQLTVFNPRHSPLPETPTRSAQSPEPGVSSEHHWCDPKPKRKKMKTTLKTSWKGHSILKLLPPQHVPVPSLIESLFPQGFPVLYFVFV